MTNSKQEYNDFVRANLPGSIRYDSVRNRYVTANNKYFVTYKEAKWYVDYLVKRGSNLAYAEGGFTPSTILDYAGQKSYVGGNLTSSFSDVVTATRTGLATQLDASGNLVWNAHNLVAQSETFGSWSKLIGTDVVTENVTTSPTGSLTADAYVPDTSNSGSHIIRLPWTAVVGSKYTQKVWAKANGYDWLYISNNFSTADRVWFNLNNGTVGTVSGGASNATITDFGDGWYLCSFLTGAASATGPQFQISGTPSDNTTVFAGDGTSGIFLWGAHAYRSDLGGMAPVPLTRRVAGSTTYVPTTSAAVYLPREEAYTYVSGSLVGPYYQKESDARTNLVTYSEDFTDASWNNNNTSVTGDNTTSPDGAINADKLVEASTTASSHFIKPASTRGFVSGTTYTLSVFAKAAERNFIYLAAGSTAFSGTSTTNGTWFNLSSGSVATQGVDAEEATIENFGNGWYRCSISLTADASANDEYYIVIANADASITYDGDGTSSILIYGAQLEQGSTPTSYIPTSGSTVTRSADSTTISAGNMPYPTPQVIGPELVTNGTFDTDSDWTLGTGWTISGGSLNLDTSVSGSGVLTIAEQTLSTVTGRVYKVTFDVTEATEWAGNEWFAFLGSVNLTLGAAPTVQSYEFLVVAQEDDAAFLTRTSGAADGNETLSIDNISVREINPLALSFQMEGLVTYADNDVTTLDFYDWAADSSNYIDARLVTVASRTGQVQFRQEESNILDFVESSTTTYSPGINVPFNIASRHGSTFINGAVDGTALTADTTPTALPDLSATTFDLAPTFNGFIKEFRVWADDIGDAGIAEAST